MTPDEFDKASPQERNEAIARALGYEHQLVPSGLPPIFVWIIPEGLRARPETNCTMHLPDWQGDDGRAFKELWPEIVWSNGTDSGLLLGVSDGNKPAVMELRDGLPWMEFVFDGDTWAHAISKAFLALKENNGK